MKKRLIALATLGSGSSEENRLRALLENFEPSFFPFDRSRKFTCFLELLARIRNERPDLVCLEGTGLAGGVALILAKLLHGIPYIVSSGDAVAPFVAAQAPWAGPLFSIYERWLCRRSAGFIGWTPYLAGRALTYGAPRAMTAAGWAPFLRTPEEARQGREAIRKSLGIGEQDLVIGIAGSLGWNSRVGYCYGWESVQAVLQASSPKIHAVIVGDGTGRNRLEKAAGQALGKTVHLVGRVTQDKVPDYLAAFDLGSLPQSVDGVGSFRYSTKISEYLTMGLPLVTNQVPFSYDLPGEFFWRLPGESPWDPVFIRALAGLLRTVDSRQLAERRAQTSLALPLFDRKTQTARVTRFIEDLLDRPAAAPSNT